MTIMDVPVPADAATSREGLGHPGGHTPSYHHALGPGYIATGYEDNPELAFPRRTQVYDLMRRTDGRVGGLLRALFGPILAAGWTLNTEGVRPEVVALVETELALGDKALRPTGPGSFRWVEHLAEALLAVPLGFMPFVPVYEAGPRHPDQPDTLPDTLLHLVALESRPPRTVQEVRVHRNGRLAGVLQAGPGWDVTLSGNGVRVIGGPGMDDTTEVWIPAEAMAFYCFEREGADWTGSSILRTAYKHWLIKDQLIRIDALSGERTGMGLPVTYYNGDDGNRATALEISSSARAGATSGLALEDGKYRLELLGVKGTVRDVLPSVEYHDRQIGESALAMVLDLGHDGGLGGNSSSIADVFVDQFTGGLNYIAKWVGQTASDTFVRELVALNFGADEAWPVLVPDPVSSEATPTASALATLAQHGLLTADPVLEADLRRRLGLPEKPKDAPAPLPDVEVVVGPGDDDSPATLDPIATEDGAPVDDDPLLTRATALLESLLAARGARR